MRYGQRNVLVIGVYKDNDKRYDDEMFFSGTGLGDGTIKEAMNHGLSARRADKREGCLMARRAKKQMAQDPYWDAVQDQMNNIQTISAQYADKQPILLFDMQEQRIYVYPYLDFKHDLSETSQRSLQAQYEEAITENRIVVFVRDNDKRKLVSYTV